MTEEELKAGFAAGRRRIIATVPDRGEEEAGTLISVDENHWGVTAVFIADVATDPRDDCLRECTGDQMRWEDDPKPKLPASLNLETLLSAVVPDDLTLGEAKAFVMRGLRDQLSTVMAFPDGLRIRFVWRETPNEELPDSTYMKHVRALVVTRRVKIVIDDLGGGMPVNAPEPVA